MLHCAVQPFVNTKFVPYAAKNAKKPKSPLDKSGICAIIQKLSDSIIEFGGIAQLGERLNGIQEVSGSIPLISTTENHTVNRLVCGVFLCLWVISKLFTQK